MTSARARSLRPRSNVISIATTPTIAALTTSQNAAADVSGATVQLASANSSRPALGTPTIAQIGSDALTTESPTFGWGSGTQAFSVKLAVVVLALVIVRRIISRARRTPFDRLT